MANISNIVRRKIMNKTEAKTRVEGYNSLYLYYFLSGSDLIS